MKILGEDRGLELKAQTVGLFDSFLAELIVPGTFVVNEDNSVGCLSQMTSIGRGVRIMARGRGIHCGTRAYRFFTTSCLHSFDNINITRFIKFAFRLSDVFYL